MKNSIIFSILIFLFVCDLSGQSKEIFVKKDDIGIKLRWKPESTEVWLLGTINGYIVERKTVGGIFQRLNTNPIIQNNKGGSGYKITGADTPDSIKLLLADPERVENVKKSYDFFEFYIKSVQGGIKNSGLYFEDKTAVFNQEYEYKITLSGFPEKFSKTISSAEIIKYPNTEGYEADAQNENVKIDWKVNFPEGQIPLCVFEKSDTEEFKHSARRIVTPLPNEDKSLEIFQFIQLDTLSDLESSGFYRISPLDVFGDAIQGEVFKVKGKDVDAPSSPKILDVSAGTGKKVILNWEKSEIEKDFIGFNIYRSIYSDSLFEKVNSQLLTPTTNSFSDTYTGNETWIFYKIEAIDNADNTSSSLPKLVVLKGNGAPKTPTGLTATINEKGIVKLNWDKSTESDLFGYRLSASRDQDARFIPVDKNLIEKNNYADTLQLNFFNKNYFYKIAALDSNFNASDYSEAVQIVLPDTIPPVPPILKTIKRNDSEVLLEWQLGTDEDVEEIEILRKTPEAKEWSKISSTLSNNLNFSDTPAIGKWQYAVRARDISGNLSDISNVRFENVRPIVRLPEFSEFEIQNKGNSALLTWGFSKTDSPHIFMIFKREKGVEKPELVTTSRSFSATDDTIQKGVEYEYFVIAQNEKGKAIAATDPKVVSF